MQKCYLIALIFIVKITLAQTPQEISLNIAKFIDATVQLPFLARVAEVQGAVRVRIILNENNLPEKYEIVQSLRKDCDEEAIRVTKLINIRNLQNFLQGKKRVTFEIHFKTNAKIYYQKGMVTEYFDANKSLRATDEGYKYFRRYPVDSVFGNISNNTEYFEFKKNKEKPIGIGSFEINNIEKYFPEFSENRADSSNLIVRLEENELGFPTFSSTQFPNGNFAYTTIGANIQLKYFSNGRIKSISENIIEGQSFTTIETNWFANGQIAVERTINKSVDGELVKINSAYDTTGNQLVKEGNGLYTFFEFYENKTLENTGIIKNGLKDGRWVGKFEDGKSFYLEDYKDGKLLTGTAFYSNETVEYKEANKFAEMKGGLMAFQQHLLMNLRYPSEAQRANITGKVFLGFDVCTDGTLCDFKILKGVEKSLNDEALRVVKLMSGKWQPSLARGKAVRTKFNLPISFMLR